MCHSCNAKKKNWTFANGERDKLTYHRLYRVYQGSAAQIQLCHLCSIDLFLLGENKFLGQNPDLANEMAHERKSFAVG